MFKNDFSASHSLKSTAFWFFRYCTERQTGSALFLLLTTKWMETSSNRSEWLRTGEDVGSFLLVPRTLDGATVGGYQDVFRSRQNFLKIEKTSSGML